VASAGKQELGMGHAGANSAPSQELLVIRRNHTTGEVSLDPLRWGLIPYWCQDPTGGPAILNVNRCSLLAALDGAGATY